MRHKLRQSTRTVNIVELKNRLSKYVTFAKAGEEVVICEGDLPVAKLVPFSAEHADPHDLLLATAGKMRLPSARLNLKAFLKMPTPRVDGHKAIRAILADREGE
jgi:antitoxin (DNA-binding transcriptional repressor) of toxin-antitoxin stability system